MMFGLLIAILATGCTREDEMLDVIETDIAKVRVDDMTRGIEFIKTEVRFDQKEFRDEVTNGLNRWVTYSGDALEKKVEGWSLDAMVQPMLEDFDGVEAVDRIDEYKFLLTDPYYLQQAYWITQLLDRLEKLNRVKTFELYRFAADNVQPDPDEEDSLTPVFAKLQPELTPEELPSFVRTMKVFDWICRNVQLESDEPLSDVELAQRQINPDAETMPASGAPGVGYQRFPWQIMMYGRGDYVERAKLMMVMLRYWDIDSVMLATGEEERPWAVGVVIGGKYYLFDTKLGLPIFAEKPGVVATLSQVQENGELLTTLNLTTEESLADDTKYWVSPDDLNTLSALVYASPESLGKRMQGVEDSLVGEDRLRLAFTISDVADRLPQVDGVKTKAWDIAFQTHQYRQIIRDSLLLVGDDAIQNKLTWFYLNEEYVNGFRPYRTARGRFFIGKFQRKVDERGLDAVEGFQRLIYDNDQIASLGSDFELQRLHGLRTENQSSAEMQAQVRAVQGQMKLIRVDAKLFLSQCLFDNANENAAGSWLEDLAADDEAGRWKEAIGYLLGRSYESRGDYDRAIEILDDDSQLQSHGNLLRSRYLKQLIEKVYGDQ